MKRSINRINLVGKRVLIRVDFNIPIKNGLVLDTSRIKGALHTILTVIKKGGKPILMSHLGRPDPKNPSSKFSMSPVGKELGEMLHKESISVTTCDNCIGPETEVYASSIGQNQVLLLENLRYHTGETSKDPEERKEFASKLAKLADVYIMDAFGNAHRKHASCYEINNFLPSAIGFLVTKELEVLENLKNPKAPFMLILGGAKVADKIPLIAKLIDKVDKILIGGGMAFTFLKAKGYSIGKSLCEDSLVDGCKLLLENYANKIILPEDIKVGNMDFNTMQMVSPLINTPVTKIPDDKEGLDIGTTTLQKYDSILYNARTIVWNGPLGVYECPETAVGTMEIADTLSKLTFNDTTTIVGGGDSAAAAHKRSAELGNMGEFTHISTGGGAFLEALKGKDLPGIERVQNA